MTKRTLIIGFLILRVMLSAGSTWIIHEEGPRLSSSVTFKLNTKYLNRNLTIAEAELPLVQR